MTSEKDTPAYNVMLEEARLALIHASRYLVEEGEPMPGIEDVSRVALEEWEEY
jgi:hypothetical protein